MEAAEAYKNSVIADAEGQASRFNSIYEEYRKAPEVTRGRMYLETIERVYGGMDKIIIDQSGDNSNVVPYLPLDQLQKRQDDGEAPMIKKLGITGLIVLLFASAVILFSAAFTVHQTQQALILRFGEAIRIVTSPGLHFKMPIADDAVYIDKRILDLIQNHRKLLHLTRRGLSSMHIQDTG